MPQLADNALKVHNFIEQISNSTSLEELQERINTANLPELDDMIVIVRAVLERMFWLSGVDTQGWGITHTTDTETTKRLILNDSYSAIAQMIQAVLEGNGKIAFYSVTPAEC